MKTEKYICDRCGVEIKRQQGTLRNDYEIHNVLLILQSGLQNGDTDEIFIPDLCEECFQSLQNWRYNTNLIEAEQKWNLSEDVERLDTALKLIVDTISGDQFFENLTEEEIVQYWMDEADKLLEKEMKETEDTNLDYAFVKFGLSVHTIRENAAEIIRLMSEDPDIPLIAVTWTNEDAQEVAKTKCDFYRSLTDMECQIILDRVKNHHDADAGITWSTLEYWINELTMKCTVMCRCGHYHEFKFIQAIPDDMKEFEEMVCPECSWK